MTNADDQSFRTAHSEDSDDFVYAEDLLDANLEPVMVQVGPDPSQVEERLRVREDDAAGKILANILGDDDRRVVPYNPELEGLFAEANQARRLRINEATRRQYNNSNVQYVLWLFKFHKVHILADFLELYTEAFDEGGFEAVEEAIKKTIFEDEVCPLLLQKFDANMFFSFLMTYKTNEGIYFSFSTYDGKRSAMMHLMKLAKGQILPFEELNELKKLLKGLRKMITKQKKELGMSAVDGKENMTFDCFKLTCRLLIEDGSPESIFVLTYLTLQWNLISRSEATESIAFSQMRWDADHLKIYFPRHKSDPVGLTKEEPRHVYSNPMIPEVCPIRALACYLLMFPDIVSEGKKLFPGSDQKSRFNRLFHATLMKNYETYLSNGFMPPEIGTHSIRKGAATYCTTGVIPGPPVVSVCLRAGWTLGRVKERYLKYEVAGDELVGRTLTGMCIN